LIATPPGDYEIQKICKLTMTGLYY